MADDDRGVSRRRLALPRPLVEHRLVVIGLLTLLAALLDLGHPTADWQVFIDAGDVLLSSGWASTFADSSVQAGPLLLVLSTVADRIGDVTGIPARAVFSPLTYAGATFGAVAVYRFACRTFHLRPVPGVELASSVAVLLFGLPSDAFLSGHSSHIWIPLLWVAAGTLAVRGSVVAAGLVVAATVGIETWGVLGGPVLLLASSSGRVAGGVASAGLGIAVLFAPFHLLGTVGTGEYVWRVNPAAPIAVLGGYERVGWMFRLVQGAAAAFVAGVGALIARRNVSMTALWAVPLLALTVRLGLDPLSYADYYYVSARLLGIWLTAILAADRRIEAVPALVATYLMLIAGDVPHVLVLGVAIPVAAYLVVRGGRRDDHSSGVEGAAESGTATAVHTSPDASAPALPIRP